MFFVFVVMCVLGGGMDFVGVRVACCCFAMDDDQ